MDLENIDKLFETDDFKKLYLSFNKQYKLSTLFSKEVNNFVNKWCNNDTTCKMFLYKQLKKSTKNTPFTLLDICIIRFFYKNYSTYKKLFSDNIIHPDEDDICDCCEEDLGHGFCKYEIKLQKPTTHLHKYIKKVLDKDNTNDYSSESGSSQSESESDSDSDNKNPRRKRRKNKEKRKQKWVDITDYPIRNEWVSKLFNLNEFYSEERVKDVLDDEGHSYPDDIDVNIKYKDLTKKFLLELIEILDKEDK